jgi:hypothetical protein
MDHLFVGHCHLERARQVRRTVDRTVPLTPD